MRFRGVWRIGAWKASRRAGIGVDEVQWQKGHKYLTLAPFNVGKWQIDAGRKRLLWIGRDRTSKTFLRFFRVLGKDRCKRLKFVCPGAPGWKPYLKVIAKKAGQAIHVLDRFHITQKMPLIEVTGSNR